MNKLKPVPQNTKTSHFNIFWGVFHLGGVVVSFFQIGQNLRFLCVLFCFFVSEHVPKLQETYFVMSGPPKNA